MARSLDAILAELDPGYAGTRTNIQNQVASLSPQQAADEASLKAQADQANTDILDASRRRGLGFSGIPVGEQSKYQATTYMPAVAKLKSDYASRRSSLDEALNSLARDQRNAAMGIYQQESDREQQQRQYEQTLAWERDKAAMDSAGYRSAAGSTPDLGQYLGAVGGAPAQRAAPIPAPDIKTTAIASVQKMLQRRSDPSFLQEIIAINKSAGYGNQLDQAKLELLRASQPGLFRNGKLDTSRLAQLTGAY